MDKKAVKNVGVTLVLVILVSFALVSLPTKKAMATNTEIIEISPVSGIVGNTTTVRGTINTTDGFFTVRWNHEQNFTDRASGYNVTKSFVVPQTAGALSGRNVTVELIDNLTGVIATANFTLFTKLYLSVGVPSAPSQFREGSTIPIWVNVTGGEANAVYAANITVKNPANQTHFIVVPLSNTTTTGYGEASKTYPTDFDTPPTAHTNTTGKYIVAFNSTGTKEFFVGLTDKSEYRRNDTVQVQATGYKSSENVTVNVAFGASSVVGFPKSLNATAGGVVTLPWKIPLNATPGTYSLSITNSTSAGTVKAPLDVQNFEILGVVCEIQTKNLAGESMTGVLVEVYNATFPNALVMKGNTNATGWIRFNLDTGNHTFKAFVKNVEVGSRSENLTGDIELALPLRLVKVVVTVDTEAGEGVPFVDVAMKFNYTTRSNNTVSEIASMRTNLTGVATIQNLFTNITYKVEAARHGMLFNSTTLAVEFLPSSPLSLDLTLPTYTLNVHAIDSQNKPADGVQITIYEWASGVTAPLQTYETGSNGDASFSLPFGKYRLIVSKDDAFLNESIVNLIENPVAFTFYLDATNVQVSVSAFDYFGQPIANAEVRIERKAGQEYAPVDSKRTGGGGSTTFALGIGGDSRISVYVAGRLVAVKIQFLGAGSNQVTFNIGEYVSIFGYPIETGLFTLVSFFLVLAVIFLFLARRRLMKALGKTLKR